MDNVIEQLFQQFLAFGGVGAFIALLVGLLKAIAIWSKGKVVIIPDGHSGSVVTILNVLAFAAFAIGKVMYPLYDFDGLDVSIYKYAQYGTQLLGLLLQLWGAKKAYKIVSDLAPFLSYSKSGFKAPVPQ